MSSEASTESESGAGGSASIDALPEAALWALFKVQGSQRAREMLFARHRDYADGLAKRCHGRRNLGDLELGELKQLAYQGLLEALDRFDPGRGIPFPGYAVRRVMGSMLNGIADMSELREQRSWRARITRQRTASLGGDRPGDKTRSSVEELADIAVGLAIGYILEDAALNQGGAQSQRWPALSTYESVAWNEMVGHLRAELPRLPVREHSVLNYHYLQGLTFDQVAEVIGLSKGRISQLHRAALERLAKRLAMRGVRSFEMER